MTTPAQNRVIHSLLVPSGMTEGEYRGLLLARFNVGSSRDLDERQARALIAEMRNLAPRASKAKRASGKYAPILQALWIAGYHLGIIRDRRDVAMLAFITRQTGLEHTRFLVESQSAAKAIEALKGWLAREGGVVWPKVNDPIIRKWAILDALARQLGEKYTERSVAWDSDRNLSRNLDDIMKAMGARLREQKKQRRPEPE